MVSIRTDADPESLPTFTNAASTNVCCTSDHTSTLFQLIHVTYRLLVHAFLNTAPNLIIDRVKVRVLGGHRSDDMNSGVAWRRYSTVARAR